MKSNARSSITLPPDELELVERLRRRVGAKTNVAVVRRALYLLAEVTDREQLRRAYRRRFSRHASRARGRTRRARSPCVGGAGRLRRRHGYLYLANLEPRFGTEAGKLRPVLIIQSDLLNDAGHPSTWVLPCTTRTVGENLLRVVLPAGIAGNPRACEIMIDQSRSIDNRRFRRQLRALPSAILREVKHKLRLLGDLEQPRIPHA